MRCTAPVQSMLQPRGLHTAVHARQRQPSVPSSAEVVVVGGGIIGTSVTYHLAKLGHDVLQLEQSQLTAGIIMQFPDVK